jgi:hypothetical protein
MFALPAPTTKGEETRSDRLRVPSLKFVEQPMNGSRRLTLAGSADECAHAV